MRKPLDDDEADSRPAPPHLAPPRQPPSPTSPPPANRPLRPPVVPRDVVTTSQTTGFDTDESKFFDRSPSDDALLEPSPWRARARRHANEIHQWVLGHKMQTAILAAWCAVTVLVIVIIGSMLMTKNPAAPSAATVGTTNVVVSCQVLEKSELYEKSLLCTTVHLNGEDFREDIEWLPGNEQPRDKDDHFVGRIILSEKDGGKQWRSTKTVDVWVGSAHPLGNIEFAEITPNQ